MSQLVGLHKLVWIIFSYNFRLDVQMEAFTVTGVKQGEYVPELVTSKEFTRDVNLLHVLFETNPLGKMTFLIHNYNMYYF